MAAAHSGRPVIVLLFMLAALTILSLISWMCLILWRGSFWQAGPVLSAAGKLEAWPSVAVIVPARDEAATIGHILYCLRSLDYPGELQIIVVDDCSSDGTAAIAGESATGPGHPLRIIASRPTEPRWSGKVWAMAQGVELSVGAFPGARYFWFTDADIEHEPHALRALVWLAETGRLDMVSTMVRLHCENFWERLLIPAFVFFFRMLYPFRLVNNPHSRVAAAAGGSMLVRVEALKQAGGLGPIHGELIDDCALARLLKKNGLVWLGLTSSSRSIRKYGFVEIWRMVARSAYTQLRRSPSLLAATLAAMVIVFLMPVFGLTHGLAAGRLSEASSGGIAWSLMTLAYCPMIRFYGLPAPAALTLPVASFLYALMTFDSALRHWRRRGGMWKGRSRA